ncbi:MULTISPECIES: 3-(methylthio)propionyl-CoA ligase [unclassified Polaromonas]|uniref:3-(methylthio)propionyl-CoA ligase n=1 Tax=unclassified Polaromonas TaxID=2638319 RepID=UPI000BCEABE6|nr:MULTISPECIES: 3-(methylthio)propionyl-CoA ligase [unclassified Polaromonas]OYY39245.1 MAG: long-chain fatty acid--CoA ligase [Polaromonas sp. 35-63-35]OYZ20343.1 MAG: long-chain fatty acid--CoA ligase [Polaromonas sp. 16-63-31]OYZ80548.1 MAG: long-chain fatty acid--CoA ligase [Polaromonas sp. 24-63-21]OZA51611.1 MAG: long-chain fatty acid--CoA ligase [Polaromonas sp. 17-63-33]OZA89919.1 MAG: long-chain fatty acid--CoA ligase [Polaromonas sp. 39-63-25]
MLGLMQNQPLLISSLIDFAERHHGDAEIVSRRVEGDIHRYTYRDVARRSRQVAGALDALKLQFSDRVATLAWNGYRHLELYFGVSGSGRVLHTLNPRLHPDLVAWIANHAEDQVLCFDMSFLPLVQAFHAKCTTIKHYIALCDADKLPTDSGIPNLSSYEAWIAPHSPDYNWPSFDENSASSMCYTSGTTGNPKAALYSHRSTILHAYAAALPDVMCLSARDSILPVVPMFHVNAWGIPYSAALTGAKLVFPGPALDGKSIYELIEAEKVSYAAGVPTVWQMMLGHMKPAGLKFSTLKRTVIGGSACPPAMIHAFQEDYGVEVLHAWGMTEMSPLGTLCTLKNKHLDMSKDEQMKIRLKQGRAIYGVDMKIVDPEGKEIVWDGKAFGDLHVKGPWIVAEYFKGEGGNPLVDGWFPTGDVATIDPDGYMQITDRSKDVIKSGGEWISSIDIENIAVAHPAVAMAACIGVRHPKWDERPIIAVVKKPGAEVTREELLSFYEGKTAKWQIPDDVVFVDAIPLGATGKMLKTRLREQLKDYTLPGL